jgi:signal recognition particle GTPase
LAKQQPLENLPTVQGNGATKFYLEQLILSGLLQLNSWIYGQNGQELRLSSKRPGPIPASVAFDTLASAKANNADVVIIDTAGRLHNKMNLMNELTKVKRVMQKVIPDPHRMKYF